MATQRRTVRDFYPGLVFPFGFTLIAAGSLAQSSSVVVDSFDFGQGLLTTANGPDFVGNAEGDYAHLISLRANVQSIGDGTTGNLTFILKNGVTGATLKTVNFAQSTTTLAQVVDLRDTAQRGIVIKATDTLQLLVTAVPGSAGTAPSNLIVHVTANVYALRG